MVLARCRSVCPPPSLHAQSPKPPSLRGPRMPHAVSRTALPPSPRTGLSCTDPVLPWRRWAACVARAAGTAGGGCLCAAPWLVGASWRWRATSTSRPTSWRASSSSTCARPRRRTSPSSSRTSRASRTRGSARRYTPGLRPPALPRPRRRARSHTRCQPWPPASAPPVARLTRRVTRMPSHACLSPSLPSLPLTRPASLPH